MTADFLVVLDACVLVPAALRDTLLRLAEDPRLFIPRWSDEIIAKTVRNLEGRIGLSSEKTAYLVGQLRKHFADSWVMGHGPLIDRMANHPKDRHVLAAAVQYDLNPPVVVDKLHAQAWNLGRTLPEQLGVLRKAVPSFVDAISQDLGIEVTTRETAIPGL